MADIQYDPACMDCRHDAVKDPAGTTWQCNGHVRAERDWLRAKLANVMVEWEHDVEVLTKERNAALSLAEQRGAAYDMTWREVESLREWKDKLEAERDDIAAWAESWMKRVAAAERERDEARVALEKSRRTIYFTWRDVEACREGLSISADIKGDTLEEVVRFLLNERDALLSKAAPPSSRPMTRDEADAVEEIESAMFNASPADAAKEAPAVFPLSFAGIEIKLSTVMPPGAIWAHPDTLKGMKEAALSSPAPAPSAPAPAALGEMRAAAERLCSLTLEACRGEGCEDPEHEAAWALRRILSPASDAPEESSAPAPKDPDEDDIPY